MRPQSTACAVRSPLLAAKYVAGMDSCRRSFGSSTRPKGGIRVCVILSRRTWIPAFPLKRGTGRRYDSSVATGLAPGRAPARTGA